MYLRIDDELRAQKGKYINRIAEQIYLILSAILDLFTPKDTISRSAASSRLIKLICAGFETVRPKNIQCISLNM